MQATSLWPYPCDPLQREDRPRLAPGTLLYAVWTFLSDPALRDQSGRPSSRQPEYTTLGTVSLRIAQPVGILP